MPQSNHVTDSSEVQKVWLAGGEGLEVCPPRNFGAVRSILKQFERNSIARKYMYMYLERGVTGR